MIRHPELTRKAWDVEHGILCLWSRTNADLVRELKREAKLLNFMTSRERINPSRLLAHIDVMRSRMAELVRINPNAASPLAKVSNALDTFAQELSVQFSHRKAIDAA